MEKLDILGLRIYTAFQSRLAGTPWIKPYTDHILADLPAENVKRIMVASPSFTADCLETLEEIKLRYQELFLESGGAEFQYIPCLNSSDVFVAALQEMVGPLLES